MFNKADKKATVNFHFADDGFSQNSTTIPLNEGKLLTYLKEQRKRYGDLVIQHISNENEIELSTTTTEKYHDTEDKIANIGDVIRQYIQEKAIPMQAHAVFADGTLKGVFGRESHARLKRQELMRKGFTEEAIEIKDIQVESYKDFE